MRRSLQLAQPRFSAPRRALSTARSWGSGTKTFQVIDTHCEGEPARILVGGMPTVPGATMYEKRAHVMEELDSVRKLMITEPRGYPCQNLDIILPPTDPSAACACPPLLLRVLLLLRLRCSRSR